MTGQDHGRLPQVMTLRPGAIAAAECCARRRATACRSAGGNSQLSEDAGPPVLEVLRYFAHRVRHDSLARETGALSFVTILALVPALTVVLSIFTMIPAFEPLRDELLTFAAHNFVPVFSNAVAQYVDIFVSQAARMTISGVVILLVVALFLVRSIDAALNRIFRGSARRLGTTIAIYWTLLTIGPLAFGVVISISSRLIAQSLLFREVDLSAGAQFLYFFTPFVLEMLAFTTLYIAVPAARVRYQDALLTAFIVTLAFELAKKLFSIFILNFSDYEAIYGTLAAIPVLMLWININWWITLLGAELCAALAVIRRGSAHEIPDALLRLARLTGEIDGSSRLVSNAGGQRPRIRVRISGSGRDES